MTKRKTITVKVTIELQAVADLIATAIEGGSNYWCQRFALAPHLPRIKTADGYPWYSNPATYAAEFVAVVVDDGGKEHMIDVQSFQDGINIMYTKYPRHFCDIVAGDDDAETADAFLQCVALGEIVYG